MWTLFHLGAPQSPLFHRLLGDPSALAVWQSEGGMGLGQYGVPSSHAMQWCRVFMKLFWTFDSEIISQCQYYIGVSTVDYMAHERKSKYVKSLHACPCMILRTLSEILDGLNSMN